MKIFCGTTLIAFALCISSSVHAQSVFGSDEVFAPVADIRLKIPELKAEYSTFRAATLGDTTISSGEQFNRILARYRQIEANLRASRLNEYESYYRRVTHQHSCSNGSGGGEKKCPGPSDKCVDALIGEYTKSSPDWVNTRSGNEASMQSLINGSAGVIRNNGASMVSNGGTRVCPDALRKSSKGVIRAFGAAIFRFRPDFIQSTVASEVATAMAEISG